MNVRASIFVLAALAASCAPVEKDARPAPLTEKNAKFLEKTMKGRVAGEPVRCVSSFGSPNLNPVSDDLILLRSGGIVYQNRLEHKCPGLGDDDDILVIEKFAGGQYCKGDTFKLIDRFSGAFSGFCRLGEFVPYRKPDG